MYMSTELNTLADLTKAPLLYAIGDKTFEVSPLDQGDFGALANLARFHDWTVLLTLEGVPDEIKTATLNKCILREVTFNSPEFVEALQTSWGMVETCFLSLRHRQPAITRKEVEAFSTPDVANIIAVATMLSRFVDNDDFKKKLMELITALMASGKLKTLPQ